MSLIRSVTNTRTTDLPLMVPGYDTNKTPVVVPGSGTLDLFTVLNDEQLSAMQQILASLVGDGVLTIAATADSSTVELSGTSVRLGSLDLLNVSADISATTVYTPTVTGMYLYSFYGTTAVDAGSQFGESPNLYLTWTDEVGATTYFTFAGQLDGIRSDGANNLVSLPIHAAAGSPIQFHTTAGNYATARWNFHFTVTQL